MKTKSQPATEGNNKARNQPRREFIKKSTLVGAGLAASAMTSTAAIAEVSATSSEKPVQKGYQLSQHVLDYYKSAGA